MAAAGTLHSEGLMAYAIEHKYLDAETALINAARSPDSRVIPQRLMLLQHDSACLALAAAEAARLGRDAFAEAMCQAYEHLAAREQLPEPTFARAQALRAAYKSGRAPVAEVLLARVADLTHYRAILPYVYRSGDAALIERECARFASQQINADVSECLRNACVGGHAALVWQLLAAGAHPQSGVLGAAKGGQRALCLDLLRLCGREVPDGALSYAERAEHAAMQGNATPDLRRECAELVSALRARGACEMPLLQEASDVLWRMEAVAERVEAANEAYWAEYLSGLEDVRKTAPHTAPRARVWRWAADLARAEAQCAWRNPAIERSLQTHDTRARAFTPLLERACIEDAPQTAGYLLARGAYSSTKALVAAASAGSIGCTLLLRAHADFSEEDFCDALCEAAARGKTQWIAAFSDVELQPHNWGLAAESAAEKAQAETFAMCLGRAFGSPSYAPLRALAVAYKGGHEPLVRAALVAARADAEAHGLPERTVLDCALAWSCAGGHICTAIELMREGAVPQSWMLTLADSENQRAAFEVLLRLGARPRRSAAPDFRNFAHLLSADDWEA